MGTALNTNSNVLRLLGRLSTEEIEVCVMHFVDGRSQTTIAEWLGTNLRTVQRVIEAAVAKVPQLKPLCVKARQKPKQPRIVHLSQIENPRDRERGPFNADEL
jgi:hypothetical protein